MGNRSFLYIQSGAGDQQRTTEVAEANNNFPTLWRILLASGERGEAITGQSVFGDAGTDNLTSDARAALDRLRTLTHYIAHHPLSGNSRGGFLKRLIAKPAQPSDEEVQLVRQLEAAIQYLQTEVDALSQFDAPRFSANIDELAWLSDYGDGDGDIDENGEYDEHSIANGYQRFIEEEAGACNTLWRELQSQMSNKDTLGVRETLLDAGAMRVDCAAPVDWRHWAWGFGVSGFAHVYFQRPYGEPPRKISYQDFMATSGGKLGDCLAYGLYSFCSEGRWGVQYAEADGWRIVQHAQWDEMRQETGNGAYFLSWVRRDGKYGLIHPEEDAVTLVREPAFDQVWHFEGRVAFVMVGDKGGLIGTDGAWRLEPCLDAFGDYEYDSNYERSYAWAAVGDGYGFLDEDGKWSVPPQYDEIGDICPGVSAAMRKGDVWGLMDLRSGQWFSAPQWASLEWSAEREAFLAGPDHIVALDSEGKRLAD